MKRLIILGLTALFTLPFHQEADAQIFRKKTPPADSTATAAAKKETAYEKLLKGAETSTSNFITLHKVKEKLYFEIPRETFEREMLLSSTLTEVSDEMFGTVGYKANEPLHVKFVFQDSLVFLKQLNVRATTDPANANLQEAIGKNYGNSIITKNKIEAWNADSTAMVIDMTTLFLSDFKPFSFFTPYLGIINPTGEFKRDNSALGEIKAFDDNVSIKSIMSYNVTVSFLFFTLMDKEPASAEVTRTLLLLPEEKMQPRISDSRVGVFPTTKVHFTSQRDGSMPYSFANRWRVEPSDSAAYARGELVEPVKPIVFYVDSAFPEEWKEPIRRSVLRWNAAFEAIGFKNVMQAKDFPTDDPEFDPDNLKYSCIRYLPSSTQNAMGPSWVDPTTGEIISASVLVYNDVVKLLNQWRFVQTAQLDPTIRSGRLTKEMMEESMEYVIAHEVGHCLGFMHNMSASNAFPVDSLRSPSFTQKYGTTPCIMDYARYNYVAQPQDVGVRLTPPTLGVYDYFLVKWSYQPVPGAKSAWDEKAVVENWVDEKAGDPIYRYGRQQIFSRYDPTAIEEDLGDDAMKAGEYGIRNLQYILSNMNGWIQNDEDFVYREEVYNQIVNQYYRYIRNALYNVGGIYLTEVKDGTSGQRHRSVPKEIQKRALAWALAEFRRADWLNNPELRAQLKLGVDPTYQLRTTVSGEFKSMIKKVVLSSHISTDPYTVKEYLNDVYLGAFDASLKGRRLTAGDMMIQNVIADMAIEPFQEKSSSGGLFFLSEPAFAPSLDEILAYGLDETGIIAKYAPYLREVEREKGAGYIGSQMVLNQFGPGGYGFQQDVPIKTIDNSQLYLLDMANKIQRLANAKAASATGDEKLHYQAIALRVNKAMKPK